MIARLFARFSRTTRPVLPVRSDFGIVFDADRIARATIDRRRATQWGA